MTPLEKLSAAGSLASIFGFFGMLYALWREHVIGEEVDVLKKEEEAWHEEDKSV